MLFHFQMMFERFSTFFFPAHEGPMGWVPMILNSFLFYFCCSWMAGRKGGESDSREIFAQAMGRLGGFLLAISILVALAFLSLKMIGFLWYAFLKATSGSATLAGKLISLLVRALLLAIGVIIFVKILPHLWEEAVEATENVCLSVLRAVNRWSRKGEALAFQFIGLLCLCTVATNQASRFLPEFSDIPEFRSAGEAVNSILSGIWR